MAVKLANLGEWRDPLDTKMDTRRDAAGATESLEATGTNTPPTERDMLDEAIRDAIPSMPWAAPALSDLPHKNRHVAKLSPDELVGTLAAQAMDRQLNPGGAAQEQPNGEAVRAAFRSFVQIAVASELKSPLADDPAARAALNELTEVIRRYEKRNAVQKAAALDATLMWSIADVYTKVSNGSLAPLASERHFRDILDECRLLPSDQQTYADVMDELVQKKSFIDHELDGPSKADPKREVTIKKAGPQETAAYVLEQIWPMVTGTTRSRDTFRSARELSERQRVGHLSPGPFGSHVGRTETLAYCASLFDPGTARAGWSVVHLDEGAANRLGDTSTTSQVSMKADQSIAEEPSKSGPRRMT
jgi:hypothetical protein